MTTRRHLDDAADVLDEGGAAQVEAGAAIPAGYDAWKLATPPEYGEAPVPRPAWADRMPEGSCGRKHASHCTLPEGHHRDGRRCNSLHDPKGAPMADPTPAPAEPQPAAEGKPRVELITTSRQKDYNACRRLHHIRYELGYRPVVDRADAEFGSIFHAGLEAWWRAWQEGRELLALEEAQAAIAKAAQRASFFDPATAAKADLMMIGYHALYAPTMGEWEVLAVERRFEAPMPTPAGAKRVRGLRVAGKLDVVVRRRADGTVWIVEHKTTTADLTPGSTYWMRLRMDTQISVYWDGVKSLGYEPHGCLYDVIAKPQQRPLAATPEEKRKYRKEDRKLYAGQRETDETVDEFKARIAAEIQEAPEKWFQRAEVVRLEHELEESRKDTYETALMIRDARNTGRAPRNPDACMNYGSICAFYDVCSGAASLDDTSRFKRLDDKHPELANDNADGGRAA